MRFGAHGRTSAIGGDRFRQRRKRGRNREGSSGDVCKAGRTSLFGRELCRERTSGVIRKKLNLLRLRQERFCGKSAPGAHWFLPVYKEKKKKEEEGRNHRETRGKRKNPETSYGGSDFALTLKGVIWQLRRKKGEGRRAKGAKRPAGLGTNGPYNTKINKTGGGFRRGRGKTQGKREETTKTTTERREKKIEKKGWCPMPLGIGQGKVGMFEVIRQHEVIEAQVEMVTRPVKKILPDASQDKSESKAERRILTQLGKKECRIWGSKSPILKNKKPEGPERGPEQAAKPSTQGTDQRLVGRNQRN